MNQFVATGRLCNSPAISQREDKKKSAVFNLAVKRRFLIQDQADTDFFRVVCFGNNADFVQKYIHKGMKIEISGEIHMDFYEKDGIKAPTVTVIAEKLEFAESKEANEKYCAPVEQAGEVHEE